jgi:hypothetical protein
MLVMFDVLHQVSHVVAAIRDCGLDSATLAIAGGKLATCPPAWQMKPVDERETLSPAR